MSGNVAAWIAQRRGGHDGPQPRNWGLRALPDPPTPAPTPAATEEGRQLWRELVDRLDTAEREVRRLRAELVRLTAATACPSCGQQFAHVSKAARHTSRCRS